MIITINLTGLTKNWLDIILSCMYGEAEKE
jgi:hypothetical protein